MKKDHQTACLVACIRWWRDYAWTSRRGRVLRCHRVLRIHHIAAAIKDWAKTRIIVVQVQCTLNSAPKLGGARIKFLNHYPILKPLLRLFIGKEDIEKRKESQQLAKAKAEKRIALGTDTRKDIMTYILRHNDDGKGMTHEELILNARAMIVAGSESESLPIPRMERRERFPHTCWSHRKLCPYDQDLTSFV